MDKQDKKYSAKMPQNAIDNFLSKNKFKFRGFKTRKSTATGGPSKRLNKTVNISNIKLQDGQKKGLRERPGRRQSSYRSLHQKNKLRHTMTKNSFEIAKRSKKISQMTAATSKGRIKSHKNEVKKFSRLKKRETRKSEIEAEKKQKEFKGRARESRSVGQSGPDLKNFQKFSSKTEIEVKPGLSGSQRGELGVG